MISSMSYLIVAITFMMFQSRNRGSFDFKSVSSFIPGSSFMFQSRNRGSFDFKRNCCGAVRHNTAGFNLVIEVLLISRRTSGLLHPMLSLRFQSRNRGSFDFKFAFRSFSAWPASSFNLVIEVLLISSLRERRC